MNISEIFIKRPVLSIILSLLFVIVGIFSYNNIPIREYPKVSIPKLTVKVLYPNASAKIVESEVTFILEENLAGIAGVEKIFSVSKLGESNIELYFNSGTIISDAVSGIRDRLASIRYKLPYDIKEPIISRQEKDQEPFLYLSVSSDAMSVSELTHYVNLYIKNHLRTVNDVSEVKVMGSPYTMLIDLDQRKMFEYKISPDLVIEYLKKNNISLPAGRYQKIIPVTIDLTASTVEDFENIVIARHNNTLIYLKDISKIKLTSDRSNTVKVNGRTGIIIGIVKTSDGNPLDISNNIKSVVSKLRNNIPKNIEITVSFDKTDFIRASLRSIEQSIIEAIILVILVILFFLRNVRSVLVPLITIPISLIGSLGFINFFGFSINIITLFALVLSVGLVVDDAIVVLENIHRYMEKGLSPFNAAIKGSKQISFAIIAMTFTLASVYIPIAFIKGVIGQIFVEFAITLSFAVIISGVVALTLSPMMCAYLLNLKDLFPRVEQFIVGIVKKYKNILINILFWPRLILGMVLCLMVIGVFLFYILPSSIVPKEDRGAIGVWVPYLQEVSENKFFKYIDSVEKTIRNIPEVVTTIAFAGNWGGNAVALLKNHSDRKRKADDIVKNLKEKVRLVPSIEAYPWSYDTGFPGIEKSGGDHSDISISVRTIGSFKELRDVMNKLTQECRKDNILKDPYHNLHLSSPVFFAKIDRKKMALLDITPVQVSRVLTTMFDQVKDLDFKVDSIRYPITLQSNKNPKFLEEIYITNREGKNISLSSFMSLQPSALPRELRHYKQMRFAEFKADLQSGHNLSQGIEYLNNKIEKIIPNDMVVEYSGASKKQNEYLGTMLLLFIMAIIFIYCILAIQFESFIDPFIIIFTIPLACVGALVLLWLVGESINVFTQVGLITLVGLITKHGILLVDLANQLVKNGNKSFKDAIIESAVLRFRPILMTTGAMIFGAVPLVFSSGAGAEIRNAVGYVLVGGLGFGTILTLIILPVIYFTVKSQCAK